MAVQATVELVKDSDNEVVVRVTSGFTETQVVVATSCTLALLDQRGLSAGTELSGSYDSEALVSENDDTEGGWVFAVPPAYVDSEGRYLATFRIVAAGKTRVEKFYCQVSDGLSC